MNIPEKFKTYIWLLNTISRSREGLTLEEINERWRETDMSGGQPMARRTFLRYKAAIEEMFGIFIECDTRSDYRYLIGNGYVLSQNSIQNWMLQTLTVSGLISECHGLQERILLENVLVDSTLLEQLITAMRQNRKVRITYQAYMAAEPHEYRLEPYCLKLFRMRWYLLGRTADNQFRVFALDRIRHNKVGNERFTPDPYFDADDFFSECYGIVVGDGTPVQRIVLRAFGREQYAMADLPLHHTQRVVAHGEDENGAYTDFELTVRPTSDLQAHLLSRGRWLLVLQPQWLADEIRRQHLEAAVIS